VLVAVLVETGAKRVFASAVDWPGWSRSGRDEAAAMSTLTAYRPRYARVVGRVVDFQAPRDGGEQKADIEFEVVERQGGDSGTDFGVPSRESESDEQELDEAELRRQVAILEACRSAFDEAAADAVGITLSVGPRGGGRSLDKIVHHVIEADQAYLRQLGSRPPKWADEPPAKYSATIRRLQIGSLTARVRGDQPPNPNAVKRLWTPRYFVRRAAWHLLDHAWEIEDRSSS
jgi:hypothetical protein